MTSKLNIFGALVFHLGNRQTKQHSGEGGIKAAHHQQPYRMEFEVEVVLPNVCGAFYKVSVSLLRANTAPTILGATSLTGIQYFLNFIALKYVTWCALIK